MTTKKMVCRLGAWLLLPALLIATAVAIVLGAYPQIPGKRFPVIMNDAGTKVGLSVVEAGPFSVGMADIPLLCRLRTVLIRRSLAPPQLRYSGALGSRYVLRGKDVELVVLAFEIDGNVVRAEVVEEKGRSGLAERWSAEFMKRSGGMRIATTRPKGTKEGSRGGRGTNAVPEQ
jgi:hypothetical protein